MQSTFGIKLCKYLSLKKETFFISKPDHYRNQYHNIIDSIQNWNAAAPKDAFLYYSFLFFSI